MTFIYIICAIIAIAYVGPRIVASIVLLFAGIIWLMGLLVKLLKKLIAEFTTVIRLAFGKES